MKQMLKQHKKKKREKKVLGYIKIYDKEGTNATIRLEIIINIRKLESSGRVGCNILYSFVFP